MKLFLAVIFSVFLTACGSSDAPLLDNPVVLTAGNQTARLDRDTEFAIEVPSSNNTVTIGAGNTVTYLLVTGHNNKFFVESRALIRKIELIGANNSVSLGTSVTVLSFDIAGASSSVDMAAGVRVDRLQIRGGNTNVSIDHIRVEVPIIDVSSNNNNIYMPPGFKAKTTITNTGANNTVVER